MSEDEPPEDSPPPTPLRGGRRGPRAPSEASSARSGGSSRGSQRKRSGSRSRSASEGRPREESHPAAQVSFAGSAEVASYKPGEQVSRVKSARRQLATAIDSRKSSLRTGARDRSPPPLAAGDKEEDHPMKKQRPGKKQRAAYHKRVGLAKTEPKALLVASAKVAPKAAATKARLLPLEKAAARAAGPAYHRLELPPWSQPKGKSTGKKKKGKGKSGRGPDSAEGGKGQRPPKQWPVRV